MNWEVYEARDKNKSLIINNISVYSKYQPCKDASMWIDSNYNSNYEAYHLIGLGLGYHLEALLKKDEFKQVTVYYLYKEEMFIFRKYGKVKYSNKRVEFKWIMDGITNFSENTQLLMPSIWIQTLASTHGKIKDYLDIIKLNQNSYRNSEESMIINFENNTRCYDTVFTPQKAKNKKACLVSAGPSLSQTVKWLKNINNNIDIYVVGAALKFIENNNIRPKGVFHSDSATSNLVQFENTKFKGKLYYLSTSNNKVVNNHVGEKCIVLQKGYYLSEQYAKLYSYQLVETGGSVATLGFSIIEALGYEELVLFGQDLSFQKENTHIIESTSNRIISSENSRLVISNNGESVKTTLGMLAFLYWFEKRCKETKLKVYNTSLQGAKIKYTEMMNEFEFKNWAEN